MKKLTLSIALLALTLCILSALPAMAEQANLGVAMPDFTFVTTDGEAVTLSEVLKEKELVHISVFASWCGPCKEEFPDMEAVYGQNRDRMEILALSGFPNDTIEIMRAYKVNMGLSFPFGLAAGTGIEDVVAVNGYPTNIFIDRFGNIAYIKDMAFASLDAYQRTVDYFLSDAYTETRTLTADPMPQMDVAIPDPAQLSAALNAEGSAIEFATADDGATYPFVVDARYGHAAAYAGNMAVSGAVAAVSATVEAGDGGALAFQVGCAVEPASGYLTVIVDGAPVKYLTGRHNFNTYVVPLTAGVHEIGFAFSMLRADQSDASFMGLKNVAVLTGDAAAEALSAAPAYPTAEASAMTLLNADIREAAMTVEGEDSTLRYTVLEDDILRFRITLAEGVDPDACLMFDELSGVYVPVSELPVAGDGFLFECNNAGADAYNTVVLLTSAYDAEQSEQIAHTCCRESGADALPQHYREMGLDGVGWCYADALTEDGMDPDYVAPAEAEAVDAAETEAADASEATYTVRVVDQYGDPVPEAAVGFCVDTGCMPIEADESGVAVYTGAPRRFHLKVVDAPDEYDYPDDTDIYIGPASGEQTLVITREE